MFAKKAVTLLLLGCMLSVNSIEARRHTSIRGKVPAMASRLLEEDDKQEEGGPGGPPKQPGSLEEGPSPSKGKDKDSMGKMKGESTISGPNRRECRTKQSKDKVDFECKAKSESVGSEIKDEIKFKVGATKGDFLKITVVHESEIGMEMNSTETETKYTVVYDRLVEYRKVGDATDDHFEWGIDEIVNEQSMNNWDSLTPLETDGDLLKFSASMGIATFSFTIAQTESLDLTTNKMKIDFLLENYPWAETGDTFLALVSHIETERTTEIEQDGESNVVKDVVIDFRDVSEAVGFVPFGEYNWATTAEATKFDPSNQTDSNGEDLVELRQAVGNETDAFSATTTTISVVASTAPQSQTTAGGRTVNEIAFAFTGAGKGADRIYWDPEAGVGYASENSSAASTMNSFAAMVAVAVGMVLAL